MCNKFYSGPVPKHILIDAEFHRRSNPIRISPIKMSRVQCVTPKCPTFLTKNFGKVGLFENIYPKSTIFGL